MTLAKKAPRCVLVKHVSLRGVQVDIQYRSEVNNKSMLDDMRLRRGIYAVGCAVKDASCLWHLQWEQRLEMIRGRGARRDASR